VPPPITPLMRGPQVRGCMRVAVAFLLVSGFAVAFAATASAATYANFERTTYAYSTTFTTSQEANSYQVMLMQSNDASQVPLLKAANPNLKIFVYQAISAAENTTWAFNSCVPGPWVLANHPNWILKDQNGKPILYQNHYLLDSGNTAFQQI